VLVQELEEGDTVAFELDGPDARQTEVHWGRVWVLCQSSLLEERRAEESAKRSFLRLHRRLPTHDFQEPFAGWQVLRRFTLTFDQRKRRIRMLADGGPAVRLGAGHCYYCQDAR